MDKLVFATGIDGLRMAVAAIAHLLYADGMLRERAL